MQRDAFNGDEEVIKYGSIQDGADGSDVVVYDSVADGDIEVQEAKPKMYSSIVAYSFVINYVLGVGILEVPYAFKESGILMGIIFLVLVTVITIIAVMWVVEAGCRAQALFTAQDEKFDTLGDLSDFDEAQPANDYMREPPDFRVDDSRKFELNILCKIFLGKWGKLAYEAALFLYMYGILTSFVNVFTSSMTAYVPLPGLNLHHDCDIYQKDLHWTDHCEYTFLVYIAIFGIITIPFSLMDLTDQVLMQVFLTAVRYGGLALMCTTLLLGFAYGPYKEDKDTSGPPYIAYKTLFNASGFGIMFTTAVFSQLFQHSTPGLAQPVKKKGHLWVIFSGALCSTMTGYIILGLLCSMYFGDNTKQLVSLNWTSYTGLDFDGKDHQHIIPKILSYFVIMYPVITVISAFPLFAITFGNNLLHGLPEAWTKGGTDTKFKIGCRFAAVLPPLAVACVLKDLAVIVELTGIAGCFIGFIFPGLLQWRSRKITMKMWGPARGKDTPYSWHGSHPAYAWGVTIFGVASLLYIIVAEIIKIA